MRRIIINQSQERNLLEYLSSRPHACTYSNPLSLMMLGEGLMRTFPIDKVIEYVKDYFWLSDDQVYKMEAHNGEYNIVVIIPSKEENIKLMNKAMNMCGYYLAAPKNITGDGWLNLQYESKFPKNITSDILSSETVLYHLTPLCNKDKILHIGFSPRCKNDLFNYPSRNYFIRGSADEKKVMDIGQQLYDNNAKVSNTGEYCLFVIDLSKISDNIKFYADSNYQYGVFTYDYIKKDCIIDFKEIAFTH